MNELINNAFLIANSLGHRCHRPQEDEMRNLQPNKNTPLKTANGYQIVRIIFIKLTLGFFGNFYVCRKN